jgi:hypothetical protein
MDMTSPNGQVRKGKIEMTGTRTGDCS